MAEKKFGENTHYGTKTFFESLLAEKEAEGFEFAGAQTLSETTFENGIFTQGPVQTQEEIEARYKEMPGVKEVKLFPDPKDSDIVWVFLRKE